MLPRELYAFVRGVYADGGFVGQARLRKQCLDAGRAVTVAQIREFFAEYRTAGQFAPRPPRAKLRPIAVDARRDRLEVDLMDFSGTPDHGTRYVLVAVDAWSKRVWAFGLESKTGPQIAEALERCFGLMRDPPLVLASDHEAGIADRRTQAVLREHDVEWLDLKRWGGPFVESVIRTIKAGAERWRAEHGRHDRADWVAPVMASIRSYNQTTHTSTQHTPLVADSRLDHRTAVDLALRDTWHRATRGAPPPAAGPVAAGSLVRRLIGRENFRKGTRANWSEGGV